MYFLALTISNVTERPPSQALSKVDRSLPESLSVTLPRTGQVVQVSNEIEAREIIAAQVSWNPAIGDA